MFEDGRKIAIVSSLWSCMRALQDDHVNTQIWFIDRLGP